MNKYSHLNKTTFDNAFDWQRNMFQKSLPPRAFVNSFTAGFLLSIQKILVTGFTEAKQIKRYFRF